MVNHRPDGKLLYLDGKCINCDNDKKKGLEYCKGCCYYDTDFNYPDLSKKGEVNAETKK